MPENEHENEKESSAEEVTAEDRAQMAKLYPNQAGWTDADIEMARALGHL